MKLHILTLVLNGMPWIAGQWANIVRCGVDYHWHVVEGAAANVKDTAWCRRIEPQYSKDGTGEFLSGLHANPRVTHYRRAMWDGKVEMCNAACAEMKEPGVLLQMDSDEIWTHGQIAAMVNVLKKGQTHAFFWCRYFFGPDIVMTTHNCYANNPRQEWKRLWRFEPGMKFRTHEPPVMDGEGDAAEHSATEGMGLVFDHYGYALEKQVAFKEEYYGYADAVRQWRKLQVNTVWPAKLCDFLGWVKDERCLVSRI
jgi:hypothetical protein